MMVSKGKEKNILPSDSDSDKYYDSDDLSDALLYSLNLSDASTWCDYQVQQSTGSSSVTVTEAIQQTRPLEMMNTPAHATPTRAFMTSAPRHTPVTSTLSTSRATPQSRARAAGKQVPVMALAHGMGSFTSSPRVSSSSSPTWTPSSSSSVSTVQTFSFAGSSGTPSESSGMLPSSSSTSASSGQRLPSIPVLNPMKWFVVLYGRRMGIFHNWVITERHISGFSHANFQKVVGSHSDIVTIWKDSIKRGLVGSPLEGNGRRAEIHWVVTVGVNAGVFNSRRKALRAIGGRNEAFAYLTAFYDVNAANAYFVEEYMEGRITILA